MATAEGILADGTAQNAVRCHLGGASASMQQLMAKAALQPALHAGEHQLMFPGLTAACTCLGCCKHQLRCELQVSTLKAGHGADDGRARSVSYTVSWQALQACSHAHASPNNKHSSRRLAGAFRVPRRNTETAGWCLPRSQRCQTAHNIAATAAKGLSLLQVCALLYPASQHYSLAFGAKLCRLPAAGRLRARSSCRMCSSTV